MMNQKLKAETTREYAVEQLSKKSKEEMYLLLNWQDDYIYNRIDQLGIDTVVKEKLITIIKNHEFMERVIVDALFKKLCNEINDFY